MTNPKKTGLEETSSLSHSAWRGQEMDTGGSHHLRVGPRILHGELYCSYSLIVCLFIVVVPGCRRGEWGS